MISDPSVPSVKHVTASLGTTESCDSTAAAQRREGGGAKCAMQDVKGAVFAQTCLFFDETGGKVATTEPYPQSNANTNTAINIIDT